MLKHSIVIQIRLKGINEHKKMNFNVNKPIFANRISHLKTNFFLL